MARFYMVTFDLENSAKRTAEYAQVRADLRLMVGAANYHGFTKQACIVQTSNTAAAIRDRMAQKLGGDCNILVVRLRYGYAFKLKDRTMKAQAAAVLRSIPMA
jgi:hypothetical protein